MNGDNNNTLTSETIVLDVSLDKAIATDRGLSCDQFRQDLGLPSVASKPEEKSALEKGEIEKSAKTLGR